MTKVASLPMYAAPPEAVAALWAYIRRRLAARGVRDAPVRLEEPWDLLSHWRSPELLFSQTCGLPFSTSLRGAVTLVGVPHYAAPGCDGPDCRSIIVARADDPPGTLRGLIGRRAAINAFDSHSGFSQLVTALAPFARGAVIVREAVISGSHFRSVALVRDGIADFASIDCVTWATIERDDPRAISRLKIVGRSPASLGSPFIASGRLAAGVVEALREALVDAMTDPALAELRSALMLSGFSVPAPDAYEGHAAAARVALAVMKQDQLSWRASAVGGVT